MCLSGSEPQRWCRNIHLAERCVKAAQVFTLALASAAARRVQALTAERPEPREVAKHELYWNGVNVGFLDAEHTEEARGLALD